MRAQSAAGSDGFVAPDVSDFWQPLFGTDGPFAVTRASVVLVLSVVGICWLLLAATRKLSLVPGRTQLVTESVYGLVRNSVARDVIGSKDFLRFVPLLFSMFILILVNNLFGVVPPIQFPTMSRVAMPAALTLVVFVLYHYLGIRKRGVVGYFKSLMPPGIGIGLGLLIYPLELITYFFTRPVTLALRLFGNMFAGHLLLLLFITGGEYLVFEAGGAGMMVAGGVSWFMAFVMTVFEILVEFLQAYIFTLLAALYLAGAVADEH
ncbi:MAG: F-type H+-transporting ATPase subunit a [Actinomycetota bacterium]|nr:F-type H+-transporting ATPase subunit a [Actinomycetota bacterium]